MPLTAVQRRALICTLYYMYVKRRKYRHYLTRRNLVPRDRSPASTVIRGREDQAYINTFGMDVASFDYLHDLLSPVFPRAAAGIYHPGTKGRPCALDLRHQFALTLNTSRRNSSTRTESNLRYIAELCV